jgi:CheY-like chemotaxis protein
MTPKVLIVDDEVDSCWLVAFVLRRDPNLALAGEATDGEMALSLVSQERPDVVVMDIRMRRLDGLEATPAEPLCLPRLHLNAVILQDRTVFVTGGSLKQEDAPLARLQSEISIR